MTSGNPSFILSKNNDRTDRGMSLIVFSKI